MIINEKLFNHKDYIIEQGVDGIWNYIKWNSGRAECWFTEAQLYSFSKSSMETWGSMYSSPATYYNYPTGLFYQNDPNVMINKTGGGSGWLSIGTGSSNVRTPSIYVIYPTARTSDTVNSYIGIYAIGKWK